MTPETFAHIRRLLRNEVFSAYKDVLFLQEMQEEWSVAFADNPLRLQELKENDTSLARKIEVYKRAVGRLLEFEYHEW